MRNQEARFRTEDVTDLRAAQDESIETILGKENECFKKESRTGGVWFWFGYKGGRNAIFSGRAAKDPDIYKKASVQSASSLMYTCKCTYRFCMFPPKPFENKCHNLSISKRPWVMCR